MSNPKVSWIRCRVKSQSASTFRSFRLFLTYWRIKFSKSADSIRISAGSRWRARSETKHWTLALGVCPLCLLLSQRWALTRTILKDSAIGTQRQSNGSVYNCTIHMMMPLAGSDSQICQVTIGKQKKRMTQNELHFGDLSPGLARIAQCMRANVIRWHAQWALVSWHQQHCLTQVRVLCCTVASRRYFVRSLRKVSIGRQCVVFKVWTRTESGCTSRLTETSVLRASPRCGRTTFHYSPSEWPFSHALLPIIANQTIFVD